MSVQTAERVSFKDPSDNVILQRHLIAYETAKKIVNGNLLEIGCGEGYGIDCLAENVDNYLAIDKFKVNIDDLFNKYKHLSFKQINVPPFTGLANDNYDSAVSFQVIEHIEEDKAFVAEIARILKKDGTAIITTPNKKMSLTRNPWHIREYHLSELQDLLGKHFSSVNMQGIFGNEKVMNYYDQNKAAVEKLTKFDLFNLQYRLPRQVLQVPYDLLNRWNRRKLQHKDNSLVASIAISDFHIKDANEDCLDFFCIVKK